VEEVLPFPTLNRVTVQDLKYEFIRNIQTLERQLQYQEFKDRVGHIISGVVKQVDHGNILVDIGRAEAIMSRHEMIPREQYRIGDRIKAYICSVKAEARGPQILLSRTHPGFLVRLFAKEVPEIYDGLIEIKAASRDPGSRAKIAIIARDGQRSFDAVGACVGVRGSRVNAVSQELQGEKIDIVPWSSDPAVFVVNAMTPAEVSTVVIEKNNHIRVVVPDHQLSIAIGRRGQNVKLAHQLTGMMIEVIGETQHTQQRVEWRDQTTRLFMDRLDLDELMAHFLVSEGFDTLQELAQAPLAELAAMQGMSEDIAQELKDRACEAVAEEEAKTLRMYVEAGGDKKILDLGIPVAVLPQLSRHAIWNRQDLADLAVDELMDILKPHHNLLSEEAWGQLILKARAL
jgi:N utilization substance protein A